MDRLIIEKEIGHHLWDQAEFMETTEALERFASMEGARRIGIQNGGQPLFLLKASGKGIPELLELGRQDADFLNRLLQIRESWILKLVNIYCQRYILEAEQLLEQASAPTAGRQGKINFRKEIHKRQRASKKVFLNHRMEGFDFRQNNLESAIFINCELGRSNFSHVNLQNAVFVNCGLKDAVWDGAFTNNAFIYRSDQVTPLKELQGDAYEEG